MESQQPESEHPDFSTLTDIMYRFYKIPYNQFQQELDKWFIHSFFEGPGLKQIPEKGIKDFPEKLKQLINDIYKLAETLQDEYGSV